MADFVERLILDDSGFINPLEKSLKKINETSEAFEYLNKEVKEQQGEMGKQIVDTNKKVNKAQDDTIKKTREQSEEFKKQVSDTKILGVSLNDLKAKYNGYLNTLKGALSSMTSFTKLSETQKQGVEGLTKSLGGGRLAFIGLAKGVNIFKAALVATGVGALVVALGSLIAFLTNTQKGIDLVSRATAAVGIVFTKVGDYAGYFGEKIYNAFENPKQAIKDFGKLLLDNVLNRFEGIINAGGAVARIIGNILVGDFESAKKASSDFGTGLVQVATGLDKAQQQAAKDGIKNFYNDVSNAVVETDRLTVALQNLEKAKIAFIKRESDVQVALEKNRNISKDISKSYTDRMNAALEAGRIEQSLTNERLKLAQEEYRIIKEGNALAENKNKDYEKEYQAAARVNQIKVESYRIQNKLTAETNGLLKEQQDYLLSSTDALRKMGVEWGTITELQDFEFAKEKQIGNLETMRAKIVDIGKSLKTDMTENLMIIDGLIKKISQSKLAPKFELFDDAENDLFNINQLIEGAEKITAIRLTNAEKEIKDVEEKEKRKKIITLEGEAERLKILIEYGDKTTAEYQRQLLRIEEIGNELKLLGQVEVDPGFWDSVNDFESLLIASMDRIFGEVGGKKAMQFLNGANELVRQFGKIAAEATQIAITQIDKQLDSLSKRRDKLERELDYELQLQSEGRANNVGDKQKEVDALLSQEERFLKAKEELNKKQQLSDLRAETASQTAALITTSINLIKGATKFLGPIGLPIGIAASAALFGFFAKTKADAFKATRLYTGAERVSDHFGFADRHGDTDLPGRGDGYRVVSSKTGRDTGVIISGREMIVPEKYSLENEAFFTNLRMGKYNGIDLDSAVRFSQTFKEVNNTSTSKIIEKAVIQPQKAVKQRVLLQVGPKRYTVVTIDDKMKDGQIINIDI